MISQTLTSPEPHPAATVMNDAGADPRRIPSHEILSGDREVILEHRGSDYRLRLTANGKLILTK